jgi:hypothetical protein
MTTQIVAIEGMTISPVKIVAMGFSPLFFLLLLQRFKENGYVVVYLTLYLITLVCCSLLTSESVKWDRLIYRAMYLVTFACIYQVIYTNRIPITFFRNLLTAIICAYGVDFLLQHLFFLIGIYKAPFINLTGAMTMDGLLKANGLAIEPSHAARILAFLYWGEMALTEIMSRKEMTFMEHIKENPWSSLSFWVSMLTMGSATAMLGAAVIATHFFKKRLDVYILGITAIIVLLNVKTDIESIERLKNVFNAFTSDDVIHRVTKTESSGASRIVPMLQTLTNTDLTSWQTWVGLGSTHVRTHASMFTVQKVGDITDFGLISYILSLVVVFKCCIRRFFCLETLIFAILFGFALGSLYSVWGAMITFTAIRYYEYNDQQESIEDLDND